MARYGLDLAGNNDAGNWRNAIDAAQICGMTLSGDEVPCLLIGGGRIKFGDDLIIQSHGYIPWHGNMAWDGFRVDAAEAVRVVEFLRSQHWTCEEAEQELFRAYDAGQPITEQLLAQAAVFFGEQ